MTDIDSASFLNFDEAKAAAAKRARKYKVSVSVVLEKFHAYTDCFLPGGCKEVYEDYWAVVWTPPENADPSDLFSPAPKEVAPQRVPSAASHRPLTRAERAKEAEKFKRFLEWYPRTHPYEAGEYDEVVDTYERDAARAEILEDIIDDHDLYASSEEDGWFYPD